MSRRSVTRLVAAATLAGLGSRRFPPRGPPPFGSSVEFERRNPTRILLLPSTVPPALRSSLQEVDIAVRAMLDEARLAA